MSAAPLSSRLRADTKEAHTAAERSGVMGQLLRGNINQLTYVALLRNLAHLYRALETGIKRNAGNESLASLNLDALRRTPSLQHDIAALAGEGATVEPIETATKEYALHLQSLSERAPHLLFAHAYLRYLGDLYGGQIMKGIVDKAIAAASQNALSFYEFPRIADIAAFKAQFHTAIDALILTEQDENAMVAEAMLGYELHARMFRELGETAARLT